MSQNENIVPSEPQQGSNLLARLDPIRTKIKSLSTSEEQYAAVKSYFTEHTENFAENAHDLLQLALLPDDERMLVSYPVIGNWVLDRFSTFQAESPSQQETLDELRQLLQVTRFHNHHMENHMQLKDNEAYNELYDRVNSRLIGNPSEARPIKDALNQIQMEVVNVVDALADRTNPEYQQYGKDPYHAINGPVMAFYGTISAFRNLVDNELRQSLNMTIMVIDDQNAKGWHERMLAAGFKQVDGQQGYYTNAESAYAFLQEVVNNIKKVIEKPLKSAIKRDVTRAVNNGMDRADAEKMYTELYTPAYTKQLAAKYVALIPNVILSDIELGEGQDGISFIEAARQLLHPYLPGILYSVFSLNKEKLEEAESRLYGYNDNPIAFDSVKDNNKANFNAADFGTRVRVKTRWS